jgi:uncharacterized protein
MSPNVKLFLIFVDETDTYTGLPLYEAIVKRLRQLDISGATVHTGIMGFGSHGKLHRKGLFGISDDRPVTIMVADSEENIRKVVPEIQEMVEEGLLLMVDAEMIPLKPSDSVED